LDKIERGKKAFPATEESKELDKKGKEMTKIKRLDM
jgi:hypothetical protein